MSRRFTARSRRDAPDPRQRGTRPRHDTTPAPTPRLTAAGPTGATLATLAILATLAATPAVAQQQFEDVEIRTLDVAPGVWMLLGQGGNIGVAAGEDGVFIVDDQYAPLTERISAAVRALGHGDVDFVVNTHWHGDHVGGNENLGEAGALIVAHENVRERMSTEQFFELAGDPVPPSPDAALPVVTFTRDVTFHLNGDEIHVFHVPHGHTDGDAVIHFQEADAVHMGDIFFNSGFPFVDLGSGGSINGMIVAVERVLAMIDDDTAVIPGHGELTDRAGLATYRDMLVSVRDQVLEMIAAGMTLEQVVGQAPTAEFDERWGGGFIGPDRFAETVYRSLTGTGGGE